MKLYFTIIRKIIVKNRNIEEKRCQSARYFTYTREYQRSGHNTETTEIKTWLKANNFNQTFPKSGRERASKGIFFEMHEIYSCNISDIYLFTSWNAQSCPCKKIKHKYLKKFEKKISIFLAYNTPRPPMSVHEFFFCPIGPAVWPAMATYIYTNVLFYYIDYLDLFLWSQAILKHAKNGNTQSWNMFII